jgi:hypothetical protein
VRREHKDWETTAIEYGRMEPASKGQQDSDLELVFAGAEISIEVASIK